MTTPWFLAVVDPDNRRPVDWAPRRDALAGLLAGEPPTEATRKLFVLHRALDLRRRRPEPFSGAYRPLEAGPATVAFTRGDDEVAVVVALRPDPGACVALPAGAWQDRLADRPVHVDDSPTDVATLIGPWRLALLDARLVPVRDAR